MGVTLGAIAGNYIVHALFGKSKTPEYDPFQEVKITGAPVQQGVFEQAISSPSNTSQNRVYWLYFVTVLLFLTLMISSTAKLLQLKSIYKQNRFFILNIKILSL